MRDPGTDGLPRGGAGVPDAAPGGDGARLPLAAALLPVLLDEGVTHVVGLPDSTLAPLFERLDGNTPADGPSIRLVPVTREGEAFAVASGLWLGGARPVVAVQCTGLMESGDALRGTAQRMGVPLVVLVSWRGYRTMVAAGLQGEAPPFEPAELMRPDVDSAALLARPTLDAWNVPWEIATGAEGDGAALRRTFDRARRESRPVALLLARAP